MRLQLPILVYINKYSFKNFLDCYELNLKRGIYSNGVQAIQVDPQTLVDAYCLEDGWTVIQSRGQYGNPKDFFYKNWESYKAGFGTPGIKYYLCTAHKVFNYNFNRY